MRWNLFFLFLIASSSCFSQQPWLFVGTYTSGKSKGIYVYRFNDSTGDATAVSSIKADNPSYLCLSSNGRHLYATDETDAGGAVGSYAFEPATGQLAFLNSQSSGGTATCYVSEDKSGKWVFVANYGSGSLAALPVNSDGSLAPAVQVIQQFGKGPNKERQEASHVHSAIFSPDEKYLLEANLGTDQEHVYRFNALENIPLKEANDSAVLLKSGTGPRHIVFHPTRPMVYILGELTGTIDAYHYDSSNGVLSHLQRIRTTPEDFKGFPGSADIHIRGDGKFLYASNRGDANSLAVFAVGKDGRLSAKQFVSVNGKHPRNFVIDPTSHFLLVANRDTDNIVIFKINQITGLLKATGQEIHVPNPVCLKFFVPSL